MTDFPADFIWGSSTAAHQVEGMNTGNDWWEWEHSGNGVCVESSGDAIDQLHRYAEDFALLKELGHNSVRISLEWSRIEPAQGEWSQAAIAHYRRVLQSIHAQGLTPVVTLHHFTSPAWFTHRGSWLADDGIDHFIAYVDVVTRELGSLMPWIATLNEPQIMALMGWSTGRFPPGHSDPAETLRVTQRFIEAHRRAVASVREHSPTSKVGVCLQLAPLHPKRPGDPADEQLAAQLQWLMCDSYLDDLRSGGGDPGDFVGLQFYTRGFVDAASERKLVLADEGAKTTQMGWEVHAPSFRDAIDMAASTGLPVLITENGIATDDDTWRIDYLEQHLGQVATAIADGVDLIGYLHWSSFDNFEWTYGYAPTFGLVAVDRETFVRTPKPSAHAYAKVMRSGSLAALRETD